MIFESMAYFAPLDGAAWWASSRISSEPGRKSPSQSRSGAGVILVDEQAMRDQEPRVGRPRIDAVASFAADAGDVFLVENLEDHAEPVFQLVLPLKKHRRRAGDDDVLDLLAEQQLAGDETGLDRLAEPDVVGDEQVDAGEPERLAKWLELVGVDPDPGSERATGKVRVRRRDAVPAEGMQIGREEVGGSNPRLAILCHDSPVRISGSTSFSQSTSRGCPWASSSTQDILTRVASSPGFRRHDIFDKVLSLADADDLTSLWSVRCIH